LVAEFENPSPRILAFVEPNHILILMKPKFHYHSSIFSLGLAFASLSYNQARADWFDLNGATAGYGVANNTTYDWLATNAWATTVDGTTAGSTWVDSTSVTPRQAYFVSPASTSYTVRLGSTGASNIVIQNLMTNTDGSAAISGATGNVTIGNVGDTGIISLSAANSIGAIGGSLTINNGINLSGFTTNYRGGTVTINGVVSGTGASNLAVGGTALGATAGTLTLTGNNSFAGTTNIASGFQLNIRHANALGGTSNGTTVSSGGALQLQGGITTAAEALSLTGTGVSTTGALRNMSGDNTYTGAITLAGTSRINSEAGLLTLDVASGNAITGSNTSLTFGGNGNIMVVDGISIGSGKLSKDGSGILTLAAANSYTGGSDVTGGLLNFRTTTAKGSGTHAIGASGALGLGVGTSGSLFTAQDVTNLFAGTMTGNLSNVTVTATSGVGIDTTAGDFAYSADILNHTKALYKLGSNKLTLSGTLSYTGNTVLDGGTLAITTTSPSLSGALVMGSIAASANTSALDLTSIASSATFNGGLTVQTNSGSANTITIGSGKTLTTKGAHSIGTNTSLGHTTNLTVAGSTAGVGTWNVESSSSFQVGGASANATFDQGTVDLSGLANFSASLDTTSGVFRLGHRSGNIGTGNGYTMILAGTSNTIIAKQLLIGDQAGAGTNSLRLGGGTNLLRADTIAVGAFGNFNLARNVANLNFNSSSGSVTIRAADGNGAAALNLINGSLATGVSSPFATFDVTGHSANLLFSTVEMMNVSGPGNSYNSAFRFDTGTLVASAFNVGTRSGGTSNVNPAAVVSIGSGITNATNSATLGVVTMATNSSTAGNNGGINSALNIAGTNTTVAISSLTVASNTSATSGGATGAVNISGGQTTISGAIVLASRPISGGGTVSGSLNLTGGSLTVGGHITTVGTVTSNLTLNGGTLDMAGFNIGASGQTVTSTFQSGSLRNLGEFNGGATLTKTGSGTLTLTGTNAYSGPTTVSAGKLIVNGNITSSSLTTVESGATLGGSGSVGALTINSGAFIAPGNSPGILNTGNYNQAGTLVAEITGLNAGTQYDQINVAGIVTLSGALSLDITNAGNGYALNSMIFLILNDGTDGVIGAFSNYAQGANVASFGGFDWMISYTANSVTNAFTGGNDVALMAIPEPSVAVLGGLGLLGCLRRRRK
jgi:fibronectin-binding autotransporter adhesin